MDTAFHAEFVSKQILKITFDRSKHPVNLFNEAIFRELDQLISELKSERAIRGAYVIGGKSSGFCSGTDVHGLSELKNAEAAYEWARLGQRTIERWKELPFPTVAAIHGSCVSGGLEWALAFHYRLASAHPATRLALPEISMGMISAWGGSVHLPQVAGFQNAVALAVKGESFSSKKALQAGLLDALVPETVLEQSTIRFLNAVIDAQENDAAGIPKLFPETQENVGETRMSKRAFRKKTEKEILENAGDLYPAPAAALKSVVFSLEHPLMDALTFEARQFSEVATAAASKNLLHLFLLKAHTDISNGIVGDGAMRGEPIHKIGITGAGKVGREVARLAMTHHHPIRLKDVSQKQLIAAMSSFKSGLWQKVEEGQFDQKSAQKQLDLVCPTLDYSGFARADLIIEAINEDMVTKRELITELDKSAQPSAIIASNTLGSSISKLAEGNERAERIVGLHFFKPVAKIPLVEIIRGRQTSDQTIVTLFELMKQWGKSPIVVQDKPGFLVNRLQAVYLAEALIMLEEGIAINKIDREMRGFGMTSGPFEMLDRIGWQIAEKIFTVVSNHLGERFPAQKALETLIAVREKGERDIDAFYLPGERKKKKVNKQIYKALSIKPKWKPEPDEIQERLLALFVNEAAMCLQEAVVNQPQDVDVAAIFVMGFPPHRAGLLRYADQFGLEKILEKLRYYSKMTGKQFEPATLLIRLAEEGNTFYGYWKKTG